MDKFIVRLAAISSNIWLIYSFILAWMGEYTGISAEFFGLTFMGSLVVAVLSFSQGKYHCKWMQALSVNLVFSEMLNILSLYSSVFNDALIYLVILTTSWAVSTILAFYFAISHFIKVKRIKRLKNG